MTAHTTTDGGNSSKIGGTLTDYLIVSAHMQGTHNLECLADLLTDLELTVPDKDSPPEILVQFDSPGFRFHVMEHGVSYLNIRKEVRDHILHSKLVLSWKLLTEGSDTIALSVEDVMTSLFQLPVLKVGKMMKRLCGSIKVSGHVVHFQTVSESLHVQELTLEDTKFESYVAFAKTGLTEGTTQCGTDSFECESQQERTVDWREMSLRLALMLDLQTVKRNAEFLWTVRNASKESSPSPGYESHC